MKKIAIALGVIVLLIGALAYNVWRASVEPVTATPTPLEQGQANLRGQLEDAKRSEAEVERQHWNSTEQLTALIKAHQHRIEELDGNSQAGEIVSYDKESIARLGKRIAAIEEQRAAREAALQAEISEQPAAAPETREVAIEVKKSAAAVVEKRGPDSKTPALKPDAALRKAVTDPKKPATPSPQ